LLRSVSVANGRRSADMLQDTHNVTQYELKGVFNGALGHQG